MVDEREGKRNDERCGDQVDEDAENGEDDFDLHIPQNSHHGRGQRNS